MTIKIKRPERLIGGEYYNKEKGCYCLVGYIAAQVGLDVGSYGTSYGFSQALEEEVAERIGVYLDDIETWRDYNDEECGTISERLENFDCIAEEQGWEVTA